MQKSKNKKIIIVKKKARFESSLPQNGDSVSVPPVQNDYPTPPPPAQLEDNQPIKTTAATSPDAVSTASQTDGDIDDLWANALVKAKEILSKPTEESPKILITLPSIGMIWRFWRYLYGERVSTHVETEAIAVIQQQNEEHFEVYTDDNQPTTKRKRHNCVSEVVTLCKIALPGIADKTKANTLVAHRFIYQTLMEKGVRPQHIKYILPMALKLVFIQDDAEVAASQFANTRAYVNRVDLQDTVWYTRGSPTPWNWFGSQRFEPVTRNC